MLPDQRIKEIAGLQRANHPLTANALIQTALDTGGIGNSPVVAAQWWTDPTRQISIDTASRHQVASHQQQPLSDASMASMCSLL